MYFLVRRLNEIQHELDRISETLLLWRDLPAVSRFGIEIWSFLSYTQALPGAFFSAFKSLLLLLFWVFCWTFYSHLVKVLISMKCLVTFVFGSCLVMLLTNSCEGFRSVMLIVGYRNHLESLPLLFLIRVQLLRLRKHAL